jgi:hypothetical protein
MCAKASTALIEAMCNKTPPSPWWSICSIACCEQKKGTFEIDVQHFLLP